MRQEGFLPQLVAGGELQRRVHSQYLVVHVPQFHAWIQPVLRAQQPPALVVHQ